MVKVAQLGIALTMLGIVITLMGLFPRIIGVASTPGFGVVQILIILIGITIMILGGIIFVRFMFYANKPLTLVQQIGIRLALTGLTFAALTGLADFLGFGSNLPLEGEDILMGPFQMVGMLTSFMVASLGVIIFALAGEPEISEE